jgi:hypothetical protein
MNKSHFFCLFLLTFSPISAVSEKPPAPPSLLILHPTDLLSGLVSEKLYRDLRGIFTSNDAWRVISREEMERKFKDYKIDLTPTCNNLNCAFDAGSIMQAQYVLYSSFTIFQHYYIFNLNLVDISATKVVWSENGEIPIKTGRNPGEALLHRLHQIIQALKPGEIKKSTVKSKGTLGILNLSPDSDYSKILLDRLSTHAYTSGEYDLIDETELGFILASLNIHPSAIVTTSDSLIPLGKRMGVDYLIYSLLKKENSKFNLRLGLFDIKHKELLREWPYQSSNFHKLLKFESKFFSNLSQPGGGAGSSVPGSSAWKWIAGPVSFIAAGVFGYLAWEEHKTFEKKHDQWNKEPRTLQEREKRPDLKDEAKRAWSNRNGLAFLCGVFLSSSVVIISF